MREKELGLLTSWWEETNAKMVQAGERYNVTAIDA